MKKHIAIFLPSLDGGGAERVMLALAERFIAQGFSCDIVLAITRGQFINFVPIGARLIKLNKQKPISASFALARYLRRVRPSVLLSTVFNANITALIASLISLTQTRVIICEANPIDLDTKSCTWLKTITNRIAARILYGHANEIIAVSAGVRSSLSRLKLSPAERIHVIPNPAPPLIFTQPNRLNIRGKPVVLACGRLEFQKDYPTLLRGFARLRERLDAKLVILGEGSLRSSLQDFAKELHIENDVLLRGFDPDPYSLMRTASVFAHTARYEGFGVVLLEALASGCPIVATDCPGGVREVLADGKFGALVPVGDHERLAEMMESVLTGKLSFPDPNHHLQKFHMDVISDKYLKILFPQPV